MKIKELFENQIDRKIEEVIKVTQIDEQTVSEEIQEYVVTDAIKKHYRDILKSISESKSAPHEGIGVWVSGFFGSGKSSFAKILGYILEGKIVLGKDARDLFNRQAMDSDIADKLNYLKAAIPIKSIIFDISMDRGVREASDRITEIMYKILLRELDYSEDFDIAKLEIDLEEQKKIDEFISKYENEYQTSWSKGRKRGSALNEASRILHLMDPKTYNQPDSWVKSLGSDGRADISPNELAKMIFELLSRRKPGSSAVFIVDEVGQYVSRSVDKMLDLQAVVQALGVEGKNRVNARKAVAPVWLVVTSQEKLNEIVSSLDDRRIELARLRDRFPNEVDIEPTDISEVTGKRVLSKKASSLAFLQKLFTDNENRINQCCSLERTSRKSNVSKENFVNLYPYLPHFIDLSIDIMSGIRLLPGAHKYSGGSNRTIIKQAQQMLINPLVNLAEKEVGTLVTIDKIFDLIKGNLSSEKIRDIVDITNLYSGDEWVPKVAKGVCLLEFVRDLPRTAENLAALLYPSVTSDSVLPFVQASIEKLEKAQFIKQTEEGYKLLTAQEKNWDIKRNDLSPKPADRNKLKREIISEILTDSKISLYKYNGKTFKLNFKLDDINISDGEIEISVFSSDDFAHLNSLKDENKKSSREEKNKNRIYFVFNLSEEAHQLIDEVYKSNKMIELHNRLFADSKLTQEEVSCFTDEKRKKERLQRKLKDNIESSLYSSFSYFRGVEKIISSVGSTLSDGIKKIVDDVFLDIYPKYEIGAKSLTGKEPEQLLTASNLSGLPSVVYDGKNGLSLVTKQNNKYAINDASEISKEVFTYIYDKHSYGEKISGKFIDDYFSGTGYGWSRDVLRLVLAALFRSGKIEISFQGKRYKDYTEHTARETITNNNYFKVAVFLPREQTLSLQQIRDACINYEAITGEEVDAVETAIAKALKKLVDSEKDILYKLSSQLNYHRLPNRDFISDLLDTFKQISENNSDDCVKYLADEGKELKQSLEKVNNLAQFINSGSLPIVSESKLLFTEIIPYLKASLDPADKIHNAIKELNENLNSEDFYSRLPAIQKLKENIFSFYEKLYKDSHNLRNNEFNDLKRRIEGNPDWLNIPLELQHELLSDVNSKICESLTLKSSAACLNCKANIPQIKSDNFAVVGIEQNINKKIQDFIRKNNESIEVVKLSDFIGKSVTDIDEFKAKLNKFLSHIDELLKQGKKIILE